jgi:DNA-binding PadR family transcriptional regulator
MMGQADPPFVPGRLTIYRWTVYNDTVKPLQEPTFLILTALAAGPQHGYGVIGDVERISDGRVRLRAGTLYAALDRLTSDELVEVEREEVVDGRLRRYYRLTEPGAARLATEAERLRRNAETATTRLRLAGGAA